METKEKIDRLMHLNDKLWFGKITKAEDEERKRLRNELQEAHALDTARQPANGSCGITRSSGESKPRRMSFREAITKAEDQIELHVYSRQYACYGILHDMCRVMAEVYMMSPTSVIRINGEDLEAGMVAQVLEELTQEMAEERAEELRGTLHTVTCLKAYLRSALYNKVFEFESAQAKVEAQVKHDMGW